MRKFEDIYEEADDIAPMNPGSAKTVSVTAQLEPARYGCTKACVRPARPYKKNLKFFLASGTQESQNPSSSSK